MRKLALIALIVLAPLIAHAGVIPFTLTLPTKNTDGTSIPATGTGSITKWRVEYGTCGANDFSGKPTFGTKTGEINGLPATLTGLTPDLAPAQYCLRAFMTNTYNVESDPSNPVTATVPPPKPGPPGLTVQQPTAYEYKPGTNSMARIGLVPVGTPCGPETKSISGVTYCRLAPIGVDFVNWPSNLKIMDAWAVGG